MKPLYQSPACAGCNACGTGLRKINGEWTCKACEVGGAEPIGWLIGQLVSRFMTPLDRFNWYVRLREERESLSLRPDGAAANFPGKDDISISVRMTASAGLATFEVNQWVDGGKTSVPGFALSGPLDLDSLESIERALREAVGKLRKQNEAPARPCSMCAKPLEPSAVAGRHFAGVYCAEDWAKYKAMNSRVCGLCRRPIYDCGC